jgi:SAM-dependent methyltransferase
MFGPSARYYDRIYSFKDYAAESTRLRGLLAVAGVREGGRLLDVACGTGGHIAHLKRHFKVEGIDLDPEMLAVARSSHPDVTFHRGDMRDFDLGETFDVVTCLFSSIGYAKTRDGLARALKSMAKHLAGGGVLAVEPWFTPERWKAGTVHSMLVEEPDLRIARMNTSQVDGRISHFDFHYLIGTPKGVSHHVERHELGLFTVDEIQAELRSAGLAPSYDAEGLSGRGLHVGVKGGRASGRPT